MSAVVPMVPRTKSAMQNSVGRLLAATADNPRAKTGTAFPISPRHLVTCRHCVPADWTELTVSFPQIKGAGGEIHCRLVWINVEDDLAILMVDPKADLPTAVQPFEFSDSVVAGSDWWSYGYPQDVADGDALSGTVSRVGHIRDDRDYIRLNCNEGEERLNGISGAPVIVGSRVVAVIAERGGTGGTRVDSVPFDGTRRYLAELAEAAQAHGAHCRWSKSLRPSTHKLLERQPSEDSSDLYCLIIAIKNDRVDTVKRTLMRLDKAMEAEKKPLQAYEQIVGWSLLGSKELLIQIRAPKDKADAVVKVIKVQCGNDFSHVSNLNITHEFVPDLSGGQVRMAPAAVSGIHIPEEVNSHRFKAFIHITRGRAEELDEEERDRYLKKVLHVTSNYGVIVDLVYCNMTRQTIVVELTLPCGQFNELFKLTGSMENGFRISDFQKSTYLAYDMMSIWPLKQSS